MSFSATLAYLGVGLSALFALTAALRGRRGTARWSFAAGMLVLAAEGLFSAWSLTAQHPAELIQWQGWRLIASAGLIGPWIYFARTYARGASPALAWSKRGLLLALGVLPLAVAVFARDELIIAVRPAEFAFQTFFTLGWPALAVHLGILMGSVVILSHLERTYRASVGTARWRIKFMLLGVGLIFVVRIYTSSQALVLRSIDSVLEITNASALVVGCILMLRSLVRAGHFEIDVYPSPGVLRSSFTILLAGLYLVLVGLVSKVASLIGSGRFFGLSGFLLLISLVGLAIMLQSDRFKLKVRLFVSRHFQRPFYDYRSAWRAFTDHSAVHLNRSDLARSMTRQVADLFQANSVSLWVVSEDGESLACACSTAVPESQWSTLEPSKDRAGDVITHFKTHLEPIEFESAAERWAETLRQGHARTFTEGGGRIAAPLYSRETFLGILILGDRVHGSRHAFGTQDFDMLRCVADHIASSLLTLQLSSRLAQARELEAFRTMATFFVHDLKNAASTLNLMLPNLPLYWDNPEFRKDALRGISKTVDHINLLIKRMSQLRNELKLSPKTVDLAALMERTLDVWSTIPDVILEKDFASLPPFDLDAEQITTVVTNLILNARDATLEGKERPGKVRVTTRQNGNWAVIAVSDNGCGMTAEFMTKSLFKPFQTTKKNGLGIGMFQSKMIVEAHGGRFTVESSLGKGTTFQIFLPLGTHTPVDR